MKTVITTTTVVLLFAFNTKLSSGQIHSKISSRKRNELIGGNGFNSNYNFFDDQLCLTNFDVSEGSIIRTKDSLALGARYINVSEFGTAKAKDDCLRLCCKTLHCNVITFEEKRGGSCYMFDCGSFENFLCKFTDQGDFMSAILRKRDDQLQIPPQIQQIQNRHEVELSQLRNSEMETHGNPTIIQNGEAEEISVKDKPVTNTNATLLLSLDKNNYNNGGSRRCSQYQFECKSSHECIGIYNACDGIAQCPDGSDEAVELQCPSSGVVSGRPDGTVSKGQEQSGTLSSSTFQASGGMSLSGITATKSQQRPPSQESHVTNSAKTQQDFLSSSLGSGTNYNNNGHGDRNGNVVENMQRQGNVNNKNIFYHKDNGNLMDDSYGNQLQQQRQSNPYNYWKSYDYGTGEVGGNGYGGQGPRISGGNQPPVPIFENNGGGLMNGNGNYGNGQGYKYPGYGEVQQPPFNNNPANPNIVQESQKIFPKYYNSINGISGSGSGDDPGYTKNEPIRIISSKLINNGDPISSTIPDKITTIKPIFSTIPPTRMFVRITTPSTTPSSSNLHPDPNYDSKSASKKYENQILQSLLNKATLPVPQIGTSLEDDMSDSESPGAGAVMAFIAGLAMSVVMVILLTCRLRRIRMSSRRRGKNRLDPDYLVDGMYL